jgi:Terminase small subunit
MDRAMQQLVGSTKRVKAGNGQAAAAARRGVFVQAYMANGHNATQAAITAGFSAKTAYSQGQRLLNPHYPDERLNWPGLIPFEL